MANKQIRQEINIFNHEVVEPGSDPSELISFLSSDYNNATFYFEVVAVSSIGTQALWLKNSNGDNEVYDSGVVETGAFAIYRSNSFIPDDTYPEKYVESSSQITFKSAKIIILQDAADITDTVTQIEVGAYEEWADVASAGTYYPLVEPKIWKCELSKFDPTPTFHFAFTAINENDMDNTSVALQESADAAFTSPATVASSVVQFGVDNAVVYYESDPFIPKDGYYYRVAYTNDGTMYGGTIFNAKVIATYPFEKYGYSNQSNYGKLDNTIAVARGQSFRGIDADLDSCSFWLSKTLSPTGNAHAKLYDHLGTYGTSSVPTGGALATSDAFDVSTLTGSDVQIDFNFSVPHTMSFGTAYVIVIEYTNGDASNYVNVSLDVSSVAHSGNASYYLDSWIASDQADLCFALNYIAITKLQNEYLLINEAQAGTGLQEVQTQWDPAEWNDGADGLPTCFHEHSADDPGSNTKLVEKEEYAFENQTGKSNVHSGASREAIGQSFTGEGNTIKYARFLLGKNGSPTGNCYAKLYDHTGIFGSSGTPTGAALAISDAFDVSTLSIAETAEIFTFSTPYTTINGTKYFIVFEFSGGDGTNRVHAFRDATGTHEGNQAEYTPSIWSAISTDDFPFEVYSDIPNSDITGDDLTRGGSALTMPGSAKEIDSYIVTA
jgi:hypothetical protein